MTKHPQLKPHSSMIQTGVDSETTIAEGPIDAKKARLAQIGISKSSDSSIEWEKRGEHFINLSLLMIRIHRRESLEVLKDIRVNHGMPQLARLSIVGNKQTDTLLEIDERALLDPVLLSTQIEHEWFHANMHDVKDKRSKENVDGKDASFRRLAEEIVAILYSLETFQALHINNRDAFNDILNIFNNNNKNDIDLANFDELIQEFIEDTEHLTITKGDAKLRGQAKRKKISENILSWMDNNGRKLYPKHRNALQYLRENSERMTDLKAQFINPMDNFIFARKIFGEGNPCPTVREDFRTISSTDCVDWNSMDDKEKAEAVAYILVWHGVHPTAYQSKIIALGVNYDLVTDAISEMDIPMLEVLSVSDIAGVSYPLSNGEQWNIRFTDSGQSRPLLQITIEHHSINICKDDERLRVAVNFDPRNYDPSKGRKRPLYGEISPTESLTVGSRTDCTVQVSGLQNEYIEISINNRGLVTIVPYLTDLDHVSLKRENVPTFEEQFWDGQVDFKDLLPLSLAGLVTRHDGPEPMGKMINFAQDIDTLISSNDFKEQYVLKKQSNGKVFGHKVLSTGETSRVTDFAISTEKYVQIFDDLYAKVSRNGSTRLIDMSGIDRSITVNQARGKKFEEVGWAVSSIDGLEKVEEKIGVYLGDIVLDFLKSFYTESFAQEFSEKMRDVLVASQQIDEALEVHLAKKRIKIPLNFQGIFSGLRKNVSRKDVNLPLTWIKSVNVYFSDLYSKHILDKLYAVSLEKIWPPGEDPYLHIAAGEIQCARDHKDRSGKVFEAIYLKAYNEIVVFGNVEDVVDKFGAWGTSQNYNNATIVVHFSDIENNRANLSNGNGKEKAEGLRLQRLNVKLLLHNELEAVLRRSIDADLDDTEREYLRFVGLLSVEANLNMAKLALFSGAFIEGSDTRKVASRMLLNDLDLNQEQNESMNEQLLAIPDADYEQIIEDVQGFVDVSPEKFLERVSKVYTARFNKTMPTLGLEAFKENRLRIFACPIADDTYITIGEAKVGGEKVIRLGESDKPILLEVDSEQRVIHRVFDGIDVSKLDESGDIDTANSILLEKETKFGKNGQVSISLYAVDQIKIVDRGSETESRAQAYKKEKISV